MNIPVTTDLLEDESDDEPCEHEPRAAPPEVSGALARRLEELSDERWLVPVLESALAQMTGAKPVVSGCEIEYCKIKPNRDINVSLCVRVSGLAGPEPVLQRLACTLFPSGEACRRKGEDHRRRTSSDAVRKRLARAGFVSALAVLEDPGVIVRAFPDDPGLPGLAPATDEFEMLPLFAWRLEACRDGRTVPLTLVHDVLHYKPRRSCAIHYQVGLSPEGSSEPTSVRAFGKLARDDRGVRNYRLLAAAWQASLASGGVWRAARPLDYVSDWRLLLQEAVPGRDFRQVFTELTPEDASAAQMEQAGRLIDAIAWSIRSLQAAPIPPGAAEMSLERLLASQERNLHYIAQLQPRLAVAVSALRADVARLALESRVGPLVFAHGDFAHGNVLIDENRVGIIDFDKACAAEAVYDVAYFLTHMWSFGIRHPRRMPHVKALWQRFRDCYLGLAPEVSPARLSLYEALDFAGYVLRNFRKQSHRPGWLDWANGQIEAGQERLELAARRMG